MPWPCVVWTWKKYNKSSVVVVSFISSCVINFSSTILKCFWLTTAFVCTVVENRSRYYKQIAAIEDTEQDFSISLSIAKVLGFMEWPPLSMHINSLHSLVVLFNVVPLNSDTYQKRITFISMSHKTQSLLHETNCKQIYSMKSHSSWKLLFVDVVDESWSFGFCG